MLLVIDAAIFRDFHRMEMKLDISNIGSKLLKHRVEAQHLAERVVERVMHGDVAQFGEAVAQPEGEGRLPKVHEPPDRFRVLAHFGLGYH